MSQYSRLRILYMKIVLNEDDSINQIYQTLYLVNLLKIK